ACHNHDETVMHFLVVCPARERQRQIALASIGRNARSLAYLLANPEGVKALFKYIALTGLFTATFGDVAPE
ncbi:hypothetical protein BD626DRAFT_408657, partial [Schizophyllum amplum]